jgi:hypothetical protein
LRCWVSGRTEILQQMSMYGSLSRYLARMFLILRYPLSMKACSNPLQPFSVPSGILDPDRNCNSWLFSNPEIARLAARLTNPPPCLWSYRLRDIPGGVCPARWPRFRVLIGISRTTYLVSSNPIFLIDGFATYTVRTVFVSDADPYSKGVGPKNGSATGLVLVIGYHLAESQSRVIPGSYPGTESWDMSFSCRTTGAGKPSHPPRTVPPGTAGSGSGAI